MTFYFFIRPGCSPHPPRGFSGRRPLAATEVADGVGRLSWLKSTTSLLAVGGCGHQVGIRRLPARPADFLGRRPLAANVFAEWLAGQGVYAARPVDFLGRRPLERLTKPWHRRGRGVPPPFQSAHGGAYRRLSSRQGRGRGVPPPFQSAHGGAGRCWFCEALLASILIAGWLAWWPHYFVKRHDSPDTAGYALSTQK